MFQILERRKLLSLHLMVIILGFTGILGKLITIGAISLVWYRMFIAFLILFIYLLIKKKALRIQKKQIAVLLFTGMVVALHWFFFFESIKVSNVSVAVICLATSSLFSAFIEPIFFKRKILYYEVLFGLIVLSVLAYMLDIDMSYTKGYFYGILSAFLATLFTILNAKLINKIDAVKITMLEMLGGVIVITLFFLYNKDYSIFNTLISFSDFGYLFLLGTICTAGIFVWMVEIMKHITPYSVIMAVNLEPIYSIIIALLIFGDSERMTTSFYIGSTIILIIVFLDGYFKTKNK